MALNNTVEYGIKLNSVVTMDQSLYRVIDIRTDSVLLINIQITKLDMVRLPLSFFYKMVNEEKIKAVEYQETNEPIELLTNEEIEILNKREKEVRAVLNSLYPSLEDLQRKTKKEEIYQLMENLSIGKSTAFKLIRCYLQSGQRRESLLDKRKGTANRDKSKSEKTTVRGVKQKDGQSSNVLNDEVLLQRFEEAFEFFVKNAEKGVTVKAAYLRMIRTYYMEKKLDENGITVVCLPQAERPSYKRFLHYCKQRLGDTTIKQMKKGKMSVRNDERLLLGNAQSGCHYPGEILEIDEVELDIAMVSMDDSRQTVGRPIVYMAVDVFSCCIVGCWVDFDNNSYIGVMNLLMTLLEDHNVQTEPYGVTIPPQIYPSCFLPSQIRVDQGSEYVSQDLRRVGRELGIEVKLVSPGTGSLKGIVEQTFHQMQEMLRGVGAGSGIILKRHDSSHHEDACLTIHDVRSIVYRYVQYHNQHIRDGYPFSLDMLQAGIEPIPAAIWAYGMEHYSKPVMVTDENREQFRFALYKTDRKFTLSRSGICYKKLYYYCDLPWLNSQMMAAGRNKIEADGVRYDPRSINNIYMMREGKIVAIPLNTIREEQGSFEGLTWRAYDELNAQRQKSKDEYALTDLTARAAAETGMEETIRTAKSLQENGKNRKKGIRDARKRERAALSAQDAALREPQAVSDMRDSQTEELPAASEKPKGTVIDTTSAMEDFSDLTAFFEEGE